LRRAFLQFSPPLISNEAIEEVIDSLRSDWITTGPKVRRFEGDFAGFVGAEAALAVGSGTDAMLVGLAALGIGPGDAVVTTAMTFCSTVHVIEHLGARPILVDVEPDTLNIDPSQVERLNVGTSNVKALMPVHLYGHPCEMDALLDIAARHNLHIVEDAAHAVPAAYKGRMIGGRGSGVESQVEGTVEHKHSASVMQRVNMNQDQSPSPSAKSARQRESAVLTAFSFYATKNMTTAEGGMLTGPAELIDEARIWSLHGMSHDAYKRYTAEGSWYYEVIRPGFKCNMTDIQAAIGIHQLRKLPKFMERRREIVRRYNAAFGELEELEMPTCRREVDHAWHLYVTRLNLERLTIDRNQFIEELKARNIGTSVHFIPIHLHPYYRDKYGYKPDDFPVAFREFQRIISLPLYPRMSDEDVQDVIDAVSDVVGRYRKAKYI